jgi:hypothetical protein
VFCVLCVLENGYRNCNDLSYRIISSDKVRALKVVLRNDLNEKGKCKMAYKHQAKKLCRCLTTGIFSVCVCVCVEVF